MGTVRKVSTLRFYKERLLRVLVHIQQNLDHPLSLDALAALAGLAPHHFHHVFSGLMGEPLAGHIRRLRLERAAWRLKLSRDQVIEIAFEAGFESHEAFSRAFHQAFKTSPSQFRRHYMQYHEIAATNGVHYQSHRKLRDFRVTPTNDGNMKVIIKHLRPMRVAFMRHIGPYHEVGDTWDKLTMLLGKEGIIGGETQFIGICHDDPTVTPANKVRYDACVTVDAQTQPQNEIGVQIVSGGEFAVLTHLGPYTNLGETYAKLLGQWLPRSGWALRTTPCFEVYLNSPENTEPEDLITDLYAPLTSKNRRLR